jgi:hypothetical protein
MNLLSIELYFSKHRCHANFLRGIAKIEERLLSFNAFLIHFEFDSNHRTLLLRWLG